MTDFQELDDAICRHIQSGNPCHPTNSDMLEGIARTMCSNSGTAWRLIDRRLQAMRKSGRLVYAAADGGRKRWSVVEEPQVETPSLSVGDRVSWRSKAAGVETQKTGTVVATREQYNGLDPCMLHQRYFGQYRRMYDGLAWASAGVLVEVRDGKTAKAKPKLYMPRHCERVDHAE
jgi:hypothetical protein